jgi:hypothetical protein
MLDPSYIRSIRDGIINGNIEPNNQEALPDGLVGLYDRELFPPTMKYRERKETLNFFLVFAIAQKEISADFASTILGDEWFNLHNDDESKEEKRLQKVNDLIQQHSKRLSSAGGGKYRLYHERFRLYVLQKDSEEDIAQFNYKFISLCEKALEVNSEKDIPEKESYALEFISTHYFMSAMQGEKFCLNKEHADSLKKYAYDQQFWERQIKASKGFEWSKKMLNQMMSWASKFNEDEELIECALYKVDLYRQEQNDAPRIVQLVANGDIDTALQRIAAFGGDDEDELRRKFILNMLCLMELLFKKESDEKIHADILKLNQSIQDQIEADPIFFNWYYFFPTYLMFLTSCELQKAGIDYEFFYKRCSLEYLMEDDFGYEWINVKGPYSLNQVEVFIDIFSYIDDENDRSLLVKDLFFEIIKQENFDLALLILDSLSTSKSNQKSIKNKCLCLSQLSLLFYKHNKFIECKELLDQAINLTRIIDKESVYYFEAIEAIAISLVRQNNISSALEFCQKIDGYQKDDLLKIILIELASNNVDYAIKFINDNKSKEDNLDIIILISEQLVKQNDFLRATNYVNLAFDLVSNFDLFDKSIILRISLIYFHLGLKNEAIKCLVLSEQNLLKSKISWNEIRQMKDIIHTYSKIVSDYKPIDLASKFDKLKKENNSINNETIDVNLFNNSIIEEKIHSLLLSSVEFYKREDFKTSEEFYNLALIIDNEHHKNIKNTSTVFIEYFICTDKINELIYKFKKYCETLELIEIRPTLNLISTSKDLEVILPLFFNILYPKQKVKESIKNNLLYKTSTIYLLNKKYENANFIIKQISNEEISKNLNEKLFSELLNSYKTSEATILIEEITDLSIKIKYLAKFSTWHHSHKNEDKANDIIDKILIDLESLRNNGRVIECVIVVISELFSQGLNEKSFKLINELKESDKLEVITKVGLFLINDNKSSILLDLLSSLDSNDKENLCRSFIIISSEFRKHRMTNEFEDTIGRAISYLDMVNNRFTKIEFLALISTELKNQSIENWSFYMNSALNLTFTLKNEAKNNYQAICNSYNIIAKQLALQGDYLQSRKIIVDNLTNHDFYFSKTLAEICEIIFDNDSWLDSIIISSIIPRRIYKIDCWKSFSKISYKKHRFSKTVDFLIKFNNVEIQKYFITGLIEVNTEEIDIIQFKKILNKIGFDSILKDFMEMYVLGLVFKNKLTQSKLDRYNRTLNLQWAIDIKNQLPN